MTKCECCHTDIPSPSIDTVAGMFSPGWGLCRACWRLVGRDRRRVLIRARQEFRVAPHLEQALLLQRAWQAAVFHAVERRMGWAA